MKHCLLSLDLNSRHDKATTECNGLKKSLLDVELEWSSFEETAEKFENWMEDQHKRIGGNDKSSSDLEAKREALKELQSLKHSRYCLFNTKLSNSKSSSST